MLISHSNRRSFLAAALGAAATLTAKAQQQVSGTPTPRDWSGRIPVKYPDADMVALDNRFQKYILFNSPIHRLYTGTYWAEGPAWSGVGRYLVWSDIPRNVQMRWLEDDGRVTVIHNPAGYSNGNTFDYQGRQISAEHGNRRVARYEADGTITTIADRFEGKRLNSPNDLIVHPDGSIWFTDPTYGINGDYEGFKAESELHTAIYRVDPQTKKVTKLSDEFDQPNGLCFSHDYKKLYVADTGNATDLKVFEINGMSVRGGKRFVQLMAPGGGPTLADGIRCDADGNIWCGAQPGVQVLTPEGQAIGMIRLPEICGNIAFGGPKRNRLFMTASQSLYAVHVGVKGGHIA